MNKATVRVPATTANLGPGFDCLALALDLWNQVELALAGDRVHVEVRGEGAEALPAGAENLVARAALSLFRALDLPPPAGLQVRCDNRIPLASGLGSSAAAALAGLLGANTLLGSPLGAEETLRLAADLEGHPDNVAAALLGGLAVVARSDGDLIARRVEVPSIPVAAAVPRVRLSTPEARAALPRQVSLADAVFNLGRTALVVEALRAGDLELLARVMDDRLHQPYRLKLIPGAGEALEAARRQGAAAALSGAGPGVVAFTLTDPEPVARAMVQAFAGAGVRARGFNLTSVGAGAQVDLA